MATEITFHLSRALTDVETANLSERYDDLMVSWHAGMSSASITTEDGIYDAEAVQLASDLRALGGVSIERVETVTEEEIDAYARFSDLLESIDDLTGLAERAGLSRRALEYKRKGERRVTQWDVWALERAVAVGAGAKTEAA